MRSLRPTHMPRISLVRNLWFLVVSPARSECTMSWSQTQQSEDLYDQITILVGSAIRLLDGDAGVFVVSNEAFDPQSNTEYTLYRLSESASMLLLSYVQLGKQPSSKCPLATDTLPSTLVKQLGIYDEDAGIYGDGNEVAEPP